MKSEHDEYQPILRRIQECTGADGRQKLSDEDQFLLDALHALEKQLTTIQKSCQEKQQAWIEFRLRFDTARSSFEHAMDLYGQENHDLERLKVSDRLFSTRIRSSPLVQDVQNELLLLQDHVDHLFSIKNTHFSLSTSTENLFYLDTKIAQDLAQMQSNSRLKLREIQQQIEQINEQNLKAHRLKLMLKAIEDNLQTQQTRLTEISRRRQEDNQSTFDHAGQLFREIEQIQTALKESSKTLNPLSHEPAAEPLRVLLERLRSLANDEYIQLNRFNTEYKSLNQFTQNYNELSEQVNESIVGVLQYVDDRSRLITPELEQRAPIEQFVQLNIYRQQIQEQLALIDHHGAVTSKFITHGWEQLRADLLGLQEELESILEKENQTASTQMKVDQGIEKIQSDFDRRPIFSSTLTTDSFNAYQNASTQYFQSLDQLVIELERTMEQFQDAGLRRQYNTRSTQLKERLEQMKLHSKTNLDHLQQGLNEQKLLQSKLQRIVADLNDCEGQLAERMTMKEYQLLQKLRVCPER